MLLFVHNHAIISYLNVTKFIGFEDVQEKEILDMVLPGSEVLTVEEVEEIANQQIETEEETQESEKDSNDHFIFIHLQ